MWIYRTQIFQSDIPRQELKLSSMYPGAVKMSKMEKLQLPTEASYFQAQNLTPSILKNIRNMVLHSEK